MCPAISLGRKLIQFIGNTMNLSETEQPKILYDRKTHCIHRLTFCGVRFKCLRDTINLKIPRKSLVFIPLFTGK